MDALKMHFLLKIGIFQPAMFVYQRISRWQFNQFSLVFQCLALQVQDPGPRWSLVFLNEEPGRRANGDWWRIWWHLSLWWFWFCNSSCKNGLDLKPHFRFRYQHNFLGWKCNRLWWNIMLVSNMFGCSLLMRKHFNLTLFQAGLEKGPGNSDLVCIFWPDITCGILWCLYWNPNPLYK